MLGAVQHRILTPLSNPTLATSCLLLLISQLLIRSEILRRVRQYHYRALYKTIGRLKWMLRVKGISRDLTLRCVSDVYTAIHNSVGPVYTHINAAKMATVWTIDTSDLMMILMLLLLLILLICSYWFCHKPTNTSYRTVRCDSAILQYSQLTTTCNNFHKAHLLQSAKISTYH